MDPSSETAGELQEDGDWPSDAMMRPPIDFASLIGQAIAAQKSGNIPAAKAGARRALEADPASGKARWLLAHLLGQHPTDVDDLHEALRLAREVVERNPGNRDAHLVASVPAHRLGLFDEHEAHFEAAILGGYPPDDPDSASVQLAVASLDLEAGRYEGGFPAYDRLTNASPERRDRNPIRCPRWNGEDPAGRPLLLHTILDGFGDAIQFIRYVPLVRGAHPGATIMLACADTLAHLLAECDGLDRVIALPEHFAAHADGFEGLVQAPVMSLPAILGTTRETVPNQVPYLSASADAIEKWRPVVGAIRGFRVGITWQGSPDHRNDRFRSIPLEQFAPIGGVPGVSVIALQKGFGREQIASCGFPIVELGDAYQAGDWMDTAAVVSQLDLIVSPDSSIAHLAGALARPTWIALPRPSEWRWMRDREDSPWYPTAWLVRQPHPGDWAAVFRRMADALRARLSGSNRWRRSPPVIRRGAPTSYGGV